MSKSIIVAEVTNEGKLRKVSYELVSAARATGGDFAAVVIGNGATAVAQEIASRGATMVYTLEGGTFNTSASSAIADSVKSVIESEGADVAIFGFTAMGRDVSSRLAAKLDAGIIADVTALEIDNGRIVATKPLYAGKIISKCALRSGFTIISIRPNNFPPAESAGGSCEVVPLAVDASSGKVSTKELRPKASGAVDLKEADVIISGGRGVKGPEGFEPLRKVATRFGWALGASRAAVDSGWIEHTSQVGQTGKTVNPKLYIACGISGAIQHLAGMQTSKVIVAINNDPEAPIFQLADYGIVGDLFTIVPLLEDELAKVLN